MLNQNHRRLKKGRKRNEEQVQQIEKNSINSTISIFNLNVNYLIYQLKTRYCHTGSQKQDLTLCCPKENHVKYKDIG